MKNAAALVPAFCLVGSLCLPARAQHYEPTWDSLDARPIPAWFTEARFGIFIHWGVYSVPAWRPLSERRYASYAEWYYASVIGDSLHGGDAFHRRVYGDDFAYRDFGPLFGAELFDPDQWADLFARSGARYVVLTSKHHDGYCLWPTRSPYKRDWNSSAVGPHRDLVGDLSAAVRRAGLWMGLYYSLIEWESSWTHRRPSGYYLDRETVETYRIPEEDYVTGHVLPQLRELVTTYQPALIFSDGGEWDGSEEYWHTREFLAWLYNEAPNRHEVVVNDRWARGMPGRHGDYYSSEYQDTEAVGVGHAWEESRGMGGSYGFNRAEGIDDYRTSAELIRELVDVVSRGGNLLLNVGPTADGRIPVIQQQRLLDIGAWLEVNGDAIYGTRAWSGSAEQERDATGPYFTRKGDDLYVIVFGWPREAVRITGLTAGKPFALDMLGLETPVEHRWSGDLLLLEPPDISPADVPCEYAFTFRLSGILAGSR